MLVWFDQPLEKELCRGTITVLSRSFTFNHVKFPCIGSSVRLPDEYYRIWMRIVNLWAEHHEVDTQLCKDLIIEGFGLVKAKHPHYQYAHKLKKKEVQHIDFSVRNKGNGRVDFCIDFVIGE